MGFSEHEATLSRSASDWEFFKMNNQTRRPFTLTKSYAALNFICELEDQSQRVCTSPSGEECDDEYCLPHTPEVSVSCHK